MLNINISIILSQVHFVGEEGVDTGGPSREFWRLFASGVSSSYCVSNDSGECFLDKNVPALQVSPRSTVPMIIVKLRRVSCVHYVSHTILCLCCLFL